MILFEESTRTRISGLIRETLPRIHGFVRIIAAVSVVAMSQADPPPLRALLFRLELRGISPSQLTIPAGRYVIVVENGIILKDVGVTLDDESNNRLMDNTIPHHASRTKSVLELHPGRHRLGVTGFPQWSVQIQVLDPTK